MCVGCASAGPPCTESTTFVCFSPLFVRVAVPDSPELLWGASFTVTESAAEAPDTVAPRTAQPTMNGRSLLRRVISISFFGVRHLRPQQWNGHARGEVPASAAREEKGDEVLQV